MCLSEGGQVVLVLKVSAVIESFLVFGLDGGNT
jgi:hypothetical protein